MNSNSAAASHQLSSFFGASSDFAAAFFPRPGFVFGASEAGGVTAGDGFDVRVCLSGCIWV